MIIYKDKPPARKRIGANPEGESGPGGPPSDHRERVRCGELKKGTGSTPALGTEKGGVKTSPFSVPRAGVEPARVAPLVFETSASTDSAIWAWYQNRREGTTIC